MAETNINAYKLELVQARIDLDVAQSRVKALEDYIKLKESGKDTTASAQKEVKLEETIKVTDTKNETRPIVEDSVKELPEESKGEKVEVKTPKKGK